MLRMEKGAIMGSLGRRITRSPEVGLENYASTGSAESLQGGESDA